jgi:hypothetical protein
MFFIGTDQWNDSVASPCLLSSRIAVLQSEEAKPHEFRLDCLASPTVCLLLQQLLQDAPIEPDFDHAIDLVEVFIVLGSKELIQGLLNLQFYSAPNVGNAIYRLHQKARPQIDRSAELDVISAHFSELRQYQLMAIEFDDLV